MKTNTTIETFGYHKRPTSSDAVWDRRS